MLHLLQLWPPLPVAALPYLICVCYSSSKGLQLGIMGYWQTSADPKTPWKFNYVWAFRCIHFLGGWGEGPCLSSYYQNSLWPNYFKIDTQGPIAKWLKSWIPRGYSWFQSQPLWLENHIRHMCLKSQLDGEIKKGLQHGHDPMGIHAFSLIPSLSLENTGVL